MRRLFLLLPIFALASLLASSTLLRPSEEFGWRAVPLRAERVTPRGMRVAKPLHFVAAWTLSSSDPNFGGISALAREGGHFVALSDAGVWIRFSIDRRSRAVAALASLPSRCGLGASRKSRDSESLVHGPGGDRWVGFENDHRICRIGSGGDIGLARPRAMRSWPITYGAETMTRLPDGRFVVIGEARGVGRPRTAPGLIFDGDPALARTPTLRFGYRLPEDYRATDAAMLPDGKLLVLERDHRRLYSFPGQLAILPSAAITPGTVVGGRTILRLGAPDLDQNFEAVAVSQAGGRTFVWLMSDDNFLPIQRTMLLLFEYRP